MSETVAQCIDRVRLMVAGRNRVTLNRLASSVGASDTTIVCDFGLNRITPGGQICVGIEPMHVWSVDPITKTVIVERAQLGSEAAAHADGDLVEVAPRFSRYSIFKVMLDEIRSWPTCVYRTATWTLNEPSGVDAVEIPPDFLAAYGVVDTWKSPRAGEEKWRRMSSVRMVRDLPSGVPMLNLGETTDNDTSYQIIFALPFDLSEWELGTDLVEDAEVPESLLDAIAWGAASRLLVPTEIDRLEMDSQGLPRLAAEVAQNSSNQLGVTFLQYRNQRLAEETIRLLRLHPMRFGV